MHEFYLEGGFYVDSKAVFFVCGEEQTMCVCVLVVVGSLQKVLEKVTHEAVRLNV